MMAVESPQGRGAAGSRIARSIAPSLGRALFAAAALACSLGVLAAADPARAADKVTEVATDDAIPGEALGPESATGQPESPLTRRVDLEWEPVSRAEQYELEIARDPEFTTMFVHRRMKNRVFTMDLQPGAYFYRVRGIDGSGFEGRWTAAQDLNINPRPPMLIRPPKGTKFVGPLPDTGIPLEWRTNGGPSKFLVQVTKPDSLPPGKIVVKQETTDLDLDLFPQEIGQYQWNVGSMGAAGVEIGDTWDFEVEGVFPRKVKKGQPRVRYVRYISPWYRNHFILYSRYGQANVDYTMVDQDLRASSGYSAIVGYIDETLNWEWHDPVSWTFNGIPFVEADYKISRQTVLSESVALPQYTLRFGSWYDEWLDDWRFAPVLGVGQREISIYQPRSSVEAARSNSWRKYVQVGPAAEYELTPFLIIGGALRFNFEFGGQAGLLTRNGDQLDLNRRAGDLLPATNWEAEVSGTLILSPRLRLQGRVHYESMTESWVPLFPNQITPGITPGNTVFTNTNLGVDVSVGVKF